MLCSSSEHNLRKENYEKHRQNTPSAISGSIKILRSDENIFVQTENKNNYFFPQFLSYLLSPFCERKLRTLFCVSRNTRMCYFRSSQSVNTHTKCILLLRLTQKSVCSLRSVDNLQNRTGDTERHRHTCKLTGGQIRWLSLECNPCWGGGGEFNM